jgi:CRP-like cAMP-binding protein
MDDQQSEKREKFEKEVAAHPFLLGMDEQHVRLLADCAMHSHFHTDGIIFREGEAANRFYLIVRGKIRLESSTLGEPIPIDEIHDGDLLGWSWLFPPTPGTSPRARWKKPTRFSFTARFCGSTARKITPSALSSSSE